MCPACIANALLIVTGTVSASGWAAAALRKPRPTDIPTQPSEKERPS